MPCTLEKVGVGTAFAAAVAVLGGSAVGEGATFGGATPLAVAGCIGAVYALCHALIALAECLERSGRLEEGRRLRERHEELQREIARIKQLAH